MKETWDGWFRVGSRRYKRLNNEKLIIRLKTIYSLKRQWTRELNDQSAGKGQAWPANEVEPTVKDSTTSSEEYPEGRELFFIVTHGYVTKHKDTQMGKGREKNKMVQGKYPTQPPTSTADACNLIAAPIGSVHKDGETRYSIKETDAGPVTSFIPSYFDASTCGNLVSSSNFKEEKDSEVTWHFPQSTGKFGVITT